MVHPYPALAILKAIWKAFVCTYQRHQHKIQSRSTVSLFSLLCVSHDIQASIESLQHQQHSHPSSAFPFHVVSRWNSRLQRHLIFQAQTLDAAHLDQRCRDATVRAVTQVSWSPSTPASERRTSQISSHKTSFRVLSTDCCPNSNRGYRRTRKAASGAKAATSINLTAHPQARARLG